MGASKTWASVPQKQNGHLELSHEDNGEGVDEPRKCLDTNGRE